MAFWNKYKFRFKKKIYSSKPKERKCKKRKEKKANIYLLLWNMKV